MLSVISDNAAAAFLSPMQLLFPTVTARKCRNHGAARDSHGCSRQGHFLLCLCQHQLGCWQQSHESPAASLPTKATTRLNRRQQQQRCLVPRAAQTACQAAAAPVLPVTPILAPEEEEIHLCAAVPRKSESLLWVRGQGRYSEGDSSVPGAGMPSQVPET